MSLHYTQKHSGETRAYDCNGECKHSRTHTYRSTVRAFAHDEIHTWKTQHTQQKGTQEQMYKHPFKCLLINHILSENARMCAHTQSSPPVFLHIHDAWGNALGILGNANQH